MVKCSKTHVKTVEAGLGALNGPNRTRVDGGGVMANGMLGVRQRERERERRSKQSCLVRIWGRRRSWQ